MELRQYQIDAIQKARVSIMNGNKRLIIQANCGAGKTIIAGSIIESALEKGKKVIFLVHFRQLAYQALQRFNDFGIGDEVGMIMAGEESHLNRPVQIISVQTYERRLKLDDMENNPWFKSADIVFYDEAHASIAKTRKAILNLYKDDAIIIGLTATPARADGRPLGEMYDDIVCCSNINELTSLGHLVPAIYYGATELPDLNNIPTVAGDYNQKVLGERVNKEKLVGDILENWLRIASDRQTVIFATNVKHSKYIQTVFSRNGINIEHIDSHTIEEDRQYILKRFKDGDVQVVTNVGVFCEGADFPWASCVVLAKPSKSFTRFIQMAGRGIRPYPGKENCLARDTEILTDKGNVKIQNITLDHRIWDGVSFVHHGGAICKGSQKTITYSGLTATLKHEVMTNEGWKTFQEAANRRLWIIKTGNGRQPIWFNENYIEKNNREMGQVKSSCKVLKVWQRIYEHVSQYAEASKNTCLSILQSSNAISCPEMGLREGSGTEKQMPKPERTSIFRLWWQRNRIQVQDRLRSNSLDKKQSWDSKIKKVSIRQDKQRRALRTWQSKVDIRGTKHEQFKKNKRGKTTTFHKFQKFLSKYKICGCDPTSFYLRRFDRRTDNIKMEKPIIQTKREVWDIFNAGPLQRFTANGLLVHNCILIDHAGLIQMHGFLDEDVFWSLDGKEKAWEKKKRDKKEKPPMTCEQCQHIFKGKECPKCGFEIPNYGKKIEVLEAELQEITRGKTKKKVFTMEEKRKFYGQLEYERRMRGYAKGWIYHKYLAKFGVKPHHSLEGLPPVQPDAAFFNWIKYQNIKWHKSRKKQEATV